jgi:hypothetical protein
MIDACFKGEHARTHARSVLRRRHQSGQLLAAAPEWPATLVAGQFPERELAG